MTIPVSFTASGPTDVITPPAGGGHGACGMLLQHTTGKALTGVIFRGSAPAITDMMAGRIDVFCVQATNTALFLRDNRIKGYAVTLPLRVAGDLPTTTEAGQPTLIMGTWHGLYAPRATPPEVKERLSAAIRPALKEEHLRQRFAEPATTPATEDRATPAFHRGFLAEEVARRRPIIWAAGRYAD